MPPWQRSPWPTHYLLRTLTTYDLLLVTYALATLAKIAVAERRTVRDLVRVRVRVGVGVGVRVGVGVGGWV